MASSKRQARKEVACGGRGGFYGCTGVRTSTERLEGQPGTRPPPLSVRTGPSCGCRPKLISRSPGPQPQPPLPQERESNPFLFRTFPASPRELGTRDPLSKEGREGARVGGGEGGHLQKGRSCRSVAGVRYGKISASQTSEPELC